MASVEGVIFLVDSEPNKRHDGSGEKITPYPHLSEEWEEETKKVLALTEGIAWTMSILYR
jgi:hypothetical protein